MADERPLLLMVEDDPGLQRQMKWSFDQYNVVFAGDREQAIAAVASLRAAVVTLDLGLPPETDNPSEGFRTLEHILTLAPTTKVIALTGQNDRANARAGDRHGRLRFLRQALRTRHSRHGDRARVSRSPTSNGRIGGSRKAGNRSRFQAC